MESRRKAISAVLGTAIALVIAFTIFVPLIMYLQSLQTIFMQEANRRLQYELERIHEKLEVHISITPAEGVYPNHYLWVIMYNPGILTVDIPTIYIESKNKGIIEVPEKFSIPPGGVRYYQVGTFYIGPGENDVVRVKVVTLRGNNYISKEMLGPKSLPYHLIVTVSNMTFGHKYKVVVGSSGKYGYGCVSLASQQSSECSSKQTAILEPQSFSDTEGLVIFQVAPGDYLVSLRNSTDDSNIISREIEVYDDVILNLPAPEIIWPETAPLRIGVIHKNLTLIANESEVSATIPYIVSLGTMAEPLRNIHIEISCSGGGCFVDPTMQEISKLLYPGETYLANFTLRGQLRNVVEYSLNVTSATGGLSSKNYERFEKPSDHGVVKICSIETMEGGDQTTYVKCP